MTTPRTAATPRSHANRRGMRARDHLELLAGAGSVAEVASV